MNTPEELLNELKQIFKQKEDRYDDGLKAAYFCLNKLFRHNVEDQIKLDGRAVMTPYLKGISDCIDELSNKFYCIKKYEEELKKQK